MNNNHIYYNGLTKINCRKIKIMYSYELVVLCTILLINGSYHLCNYIKVFKEKTQLFYYLIEILKYIFLKLNKIKLVIKKEPNLWYICLYTSGAADTDNLYLFDRCVEIIYSYIYIIFFFEIVN